MKVFPQVSTRIPTRRCGEYRLILYTNDVDDKQHCALVYGPRIRSKGLAATAKSSGNGNEPALSGSIDDSSRSKGGPGCSESKAAGPQKDGPRERPVLTRIHSSCFTGETLLSSRCDCAVGWLV